MSATVPPSTDGSSKEERLKQYLLEKAQDGEMYFKSKFIADDVGLSPKEIGALMVKLRGASSVATHSPPETTDHELRRSSNRPHASSRSPFLRLFSPLESGGVGGQDL
jgi:hypothetical protein